ncbi:DUF1836 domain-containing protein [uncultured Tyzzerella sp.]|uniref:DUF1836 domain-containing protein n=1 Tax=uncultured Tyzzerella sp. TaxID=2321398 RepID=UPI002942F404|nr:DUF1836 domain-containing protein [uncultured Tyzzerella sp.]
MNEKEILDVLKEYINIEDINIDKIPNIELYMDQVTTFIDDSLNAYKRNDDQKIITKTMINNYTKDKILSPPNKKKYNKEHLILLILIYHLKSILSINDIGLILKNKEKNIEDIYTKFIYNKKISDNNFYKDVENFLSSVEKNEEDRTNLIIFLLNIINEANQRKYLAEKIIDLYFKK